VEYADEFPWSHNTAVNLNTTIFRNFARRHIPLFVAVLGRQGPTIQSRIKTQSESI
jgi:hypothetical protein